jgi:uncharacterized membrane protein
MLIQRTITFSSAVLIFAAVALGAGLVSFWWLPGTTQLENPGVPNLLAGNNVVMVLQCFNPIARNVSGFYYSLSIFILSCLTLYYIKKVIKLLILPLFISCFSAPVFYG